MPSGVKFRPTSKNRTLQQIRDPVVVADRLWVKDHLDPDEENLRFST